MKVLLRGVHLDLSDALRAYVDEHLVSHIERFADDEAAEIECRVTVRLPGLAAVHVTETADSLFPAIDASRDRLEKTLKRTLEKRREAHTAGLPQDTAADVPTY
jgi:ribosomal subunit interface protein